MTIQTITSAPTNNQATAFPNQKKEATLSIGREVVVVGDTTTNAKFFWSDDHWATKTDYGSDIAGWSNGSIFPYVDSGGTERLVVVWKQSGTGGSPARTDGQHYLAVGTFNVGRTTLTWSTALSVAGSGTTVENYPDLIACPEGTGGAALVAFGYSDASSNQPRGRTASIDSSGVPTWTTAYSILGTDSALGGTLMLPMPSLAIDPVTKTAFMGWTLPGTGTGKGVRFRPFTYSAGAWTAGTEVAVDTARYVFSSVGYGLICRWDGTRVVLAGHLYDGANVNAVIYDSTSFTAFTNRATSVNLTNPTFLLGFSAAVDGTTGDVYLWGSQYNGSAYADAAYVKATRSGSSLTLGSRTVTDTFTGSGSTPPYTSAWFGGAGINVIYTTGSSGTFPVKADRIALGTAPTIAVTGPADGTSTVNATPDFTVTVTDPDSSQTLTVTVEISTTNFGTALQTLTTTQATPASAVSKTVTATALARGATYYWRAKVSDGTSTSAWTTVRSITIYKAGQLWPRGNRP